MVRTRSKKKKALEDDQLEERSNIEKLPVDLEIEILKRLPVKSIGRFLLVSKLWATSIHNQYLITPRILVAFVDLDSQTKLQNWYFFSSSSSSLSSLLASSSSSSSPSTSFLSTSFLSRGACPFLNLDHNRILMEYRSHYVNGLICLGYGPEQTICNLSTGKSITLPRVETRLKLAKSFLGYDPVNDQYKVLCMMVKTPQTSRGEPSSQHQVFTLGAKQKSWRMIDCIIPHLPFSNGVCIDGVVYYLAYTWAYRSQQSLMRFYLRSEKLDLLTTSSAVRDGRSTLINYKGKVALATVKLGYTFDLWVMDQDAENHVWLKKSFSLEPWKRSLFQPSYFNLSIACATHTGDFIVVRGASYYSDDVFLYNPDKNIFRRIKIEVSRDYEFKLGQTRAVVFLDYGESVRSL